MTKSILKVATGIDLTQETVTQTFGFIGRKGSGKTYATGKLAEEMLSIGAQVVILDPLGNWFGLRLDRAGKKPSQFTLPIFGGEHGDVPLEHTGGSLVADFVVDTGSSCVLDVSAFRKSQRKEFVADFAEQLFHKKKGNRSPMHLIIEEAQVFAPQRAGRGEERMLGAIEDIVRLGRNVGIGCSMISQRPQSVNKEVLNQAEPLVVFQLVAKQERDAVARWMEHIGAELGEALRELPSLEVGDCFFWSPAWLRVFRKTRFLKKQTFDASATPEVGKGIRSPKKLAPVDLGSLEKAMAATIEKSKADDPKILRKEITKLKRELVKKPTAAVDQSQIERAVHTALTNRDREWEKKTAELKRSSMKLTEKLEKIGIIAHLNGEAPKNVALPQIGKRYNSPREIQPNPKKARNTPINGDIAKGEKMILIAVAQYEEGATREQITILTGYKRSTRDAYLQRLREKGFVETGSLITATDDGIEALGSDYEPLPQGDELRSYWLNRLPEGERKILETTIAAWPNEIDRDSVSDQTDYKRSTRDAYIQRLKARQLISIDRGTIRAKETLFD